VTRLPLDAPTVLQALSIELEHEPVDADQVVSGSPTTGIAALTEIAQQAQSRWSLGDVLVIHRYGRLEPGALIMMVATAAPHRKDAFEAAEYLMDYLKSRAPFWKKEHIGADASWVSAKDADEDALSRW